MAILIIAEKTNQGLYRSLAIGRERVKIFRRKEAINSIRKRSTEIILLDAGFAVEKGLRLLKKIKSLYPFIPVIFLTGDESEDIVLRAFRGGARDFFRKPFSIQELQDTIKGLLSIKRSAKEKRSPFIKQKISDTEKRAKTSEINQRIDFLQTIGYIEKNLSDEIDLETLAISAYMSKYHFCRLFKKRVGLSPMRFVTFKRIERAKELLGKSDISVSGIAINVGFNDLSTFISHFKKFTGMTPNIYRKSLPGNSPRLKK